MDLELKLEIYSKNNIPLPDGLEPEFREYMSQLTLSVSSAEGELAHLHDQLNLYQSETKAVKEQLDASLAVLARFSAIRSPFRRMPSELLLPIMYLAMVDLDGYVGKEGRYIFKQLRCISKIWRDAAFSSPELWNHWRSTSMKPLTGSR